MAMKPQGLEIVLDTRMTIGESPTWVAEEAALYFVDVKAPALHRYHPASGHTKSWPLTSDVGAFCLMADGGVLVALRNGLSRLDLDTGELEALVPAPFDPKLFRFNEGGCDPVGRFWVGVMFDPLEGNPPAQKGELRSFTLHGGLRREPDAAELHNGMAWSADGGSLYLSHSYMRTIWRFDFDCVEGRLGQKELFAELPEKFGIPDGAAIDVEGGYWCALHGGGRIRRYHRDGSVDRDLEWPVSQPTMCAFAGDDLDTLYVTTASDNMTEDQLAAEPHAGALFRFKPGVKGIAKRIRLAAR